MALRLNDLVVCGEIFNTRKNSVHGWLELRDVEQPLDFELTGNCDPDLAGRHIRFEARPNAWVDEDADNEPRRLEGLAWRQIGPTGTMTAARRVRVADCPVKELYVRSKLGEPPPTRWVRCLYLEWFGQNGRVVVELGDPIIEFVDADEHEDAPPPDLPFLGEPEEEEEDSAAFGLGVTSIGIDDEGRVEIRDVPLPAEGPEVLADETDDAMIPEELQRMFDREAYEIDQAIQGDEDKPECIRECELMDDLIEHSDGEPVASIFDTPMSLRPTDELDDEEVEGALKCLLAELALCGVALDVCEHFTPRDTYRLLVERIFKEERFFPELRGTQWVQHFMTSEYCEECEAEMDREFEERERRGKENPNEDSGL